MSMSIRIFILVSLQLTYIIRYKGHLVYLLSIHRKRSSQENMSVRESKKECERTCVCVFSAYFPLLCECPL